MAKETQGGKNHVQVKAMLHFSFVTTTEQAVSLSKELSM